MIYKNTFEREHKYDGVNPAIIPKYNKGRDLAFLYVVIFRNECWHLIYFHLMEF